MSQDMGLGGLDSQGFKYLNRRIMETFDITNIFSIDIIDCFKTTPFQSIEIIVTGISRKESTDVLHPLLPHHIVGRLTEGKSELELSPFDQLYIGRGTTRRFGGHLDPLKRFVHDFGPPASPDIIETSFRTCPEGDELLGI